MTAVHGGPPSGRVHSIQVKFAVGYTLVILAVLLLLNTYPLLMTQNMMFRSKENAIQSQSLVLSNALAAMDKLTAEGVEQTLSLLDDLRFTRALVTDGAGMVLYDTGEEPLTGRYALVEGVVSALRGNDVFRCQYTKGMFRSWSAAPVINRGQVVGAVCLYESDGGQGALLQEIQSNLGLISIVVCVLVLVMSRFLSYILTNRIDTLLGAIRTVREGEYTHRIKIAGRDELTQLADEFNQLTGRLQVNEEERRRFVSDASHELKTPLASIKLLSDSILQDEAMPPATTREFVEDIGEAADRLIRISEDLLTLNRLDAGHRATPTQPVAVAPVVEETCRMLAPQAHAQDVTVETQLDPACVVLATEKDVSMIVGNLVENAIKYNLPRGKVTVTVWRDDKVHITVEDTGVGIPAEDLSRIFDRFYRVDKARSREAGGTGLGLSIVRDTVRGHGGEIAVYPGQEAGVCFAVTFPLCREEGTP